MDLRTLRYFVYVAEARSFSKAAIQLRITQPALSRQIRKLEDEVGVALVERTTRFIRTVPQVLHKYGVPLESADLRHAEGYAVKLKGLSIAADAKQPQQPTSKQ